MCGRTQRCSTCLACTRCWVPSPVPPFKTNKQKIWKLLLELCEMQSDSWKSPSGPRVHLEMGREDTNPRASRNPRLWMVRLPGAELALICYNLTSPLNVSSPQWHQQLLSPLRWLCWADVLLRWALCRTDLAKAPVPCASSVCLCLSERGWGEWEPVFTLSVKWSPHHGVPSIFSMVF